MISLDECIQRVVRSEFNQSTVLTIAHRLDTIIDSDRVLVLDKGQLKELDTPASLLSQPQSIFSGLVQSAIFAANSFENKTQ